MRASCLKVTGLAWLLLLAMTSVLLAQEQGTEHLNPARPEAWTMNYFTSATLLAGFAPPRSRPLGSTEVGIELDWLPYLSAEERLVGFNGTTEVDTNKCPVFFRPRVTVGLPWQFALTVSYLPPFELCGVKPNLFAFALERPLYEHLPWRVGLRAYGQIGDLEGDFTCPEDVVRFTPGSPQNPQGCQGKSSDTITMRYGGLELSGSYRIAQAAGLTPYLGVAVNYLDTRFQVHAQTFGFPDRRRQSADTWTFSMTAGVTYPITERLHLSVGLFYSPLWVVRPPNTDSQNDPLFNVRTLLSYQFGPSPVPLPPGASGRQGS